MSINRHNDSRIRKMSTGKKGFASAAAALVDMQAGFDELERKAAAGAGLAKAQNQLEKLEKAQKKQGEEQEKFGNEQSLLTKEHFQLEVRHEGLRKEQKKLEAVVAELREQHQNLYLRAALEKARGEHETHMASLERHRVKQWQMIEELVEARNMDHFLLKELIGRIGKLERSRPKQGGEDDDDDMPRKRQKMTATGNGKAPTAASAAATTTNPVGGLSRAAAPSSTAAPPVVASASSSASASA
ncbi:hypothetical protein B0T26DRAFT_671609 [Lasiosphaeria miniovina]|uniref:Uncharacterized protein n=1 Tax=Lasiosphaeria miniovina TaxID=1954250 RepID=A0AA40B383_9PEZI|nr:uncharacterized protein B0T26DRAFT_671609 [Lasiosphaeria miniovina]KAK0726867.1 hypothetical protein B0T26DRAFT_671609 [Lasiosphaeria miniovina]